MYMLGDTVRIYELVRADEPADKERGLGKQFIINQDASRQGTVVRIDEDLRGNQTQIFVEFENGDMQNYPAEAENVKHV